MWLWEPTNLFKCKGALTIVITYANVSSSVTRGTSPFFLAKTFTSTVADLYPHSFVGAFSPGALSRYHQGMVMFHGLVARRIFQSRRRFASQVVLGQFENAQPFGFSYATETQGIGAWSIEVGSLHRHSLDFLQVRRCSIYCPAMAYRLFDIPTGCNHGVANTQSIDTTQAAMQFMMGSRFDLRYITTVVPVNHAAVLKLHSILKQDLERVILIHLLPPPKNICSLQIPGFKNGPVGCVCARFPHSE